MITFFVQRDPESREFFIIKDDGRTQTVVGYPHTDLSIAQHNAESAAHAEVRHNGGEAVWTTKPDEVAEREYRLCGRYGSRAAWIVRQQDRT